MSVKLHADSRAGDNSFFLPCCAKQLPIVVVVVVTFLLILSLFRLNVSLFALLLPFWKECIGNESPSTLSRAVEYGICEPRRQPVPLEFFVNFGLRNIERLLPTQLPMLVHTSAHASSRRHTHTLRPGLPACQRTMTTGGGSACAHFYFAPPAPKDILGLAP